MSDQERLEFFQNFAKVLEENKSEDKRREILEEAGIIDHKGNLTPAYQTSAK